MPVLLYAEGVASKKYARHLERVLLVDPLPASARLLHELLKDLGGRYIRLESSLKGAMTAAREDDPQIIFDKESLMRRSDAAAPLLRTLDK